MTDDGRDPFDELARRAGAEVRRAAPDDGLQRLRRSRRRRRLATGTAVGVVVVVLGAGAALVASRGDDRDSTVVEVPTTASTTSTTVLVTVPPPPTSAIATTTVSVPATTTTTIAAEPTTTSIAPTSTTTDATTTTSLVAPSPPGVPTDQAAMVFAGSGGAFAWTPLGGWDGSRWSDRVESTSITSVSAVGVGIGDETLSGLHLGPEGSRCPGPEMGPTIDLGREAVDDGQGSPVLAVTADWPLQPRPVVRAGVDAAVYQQVAESVVAGHDAVDPAKGDVTEVIRSDLNGDGIDEVVFGFEYFSAPDIGAARGDFSVVIARLPGADGTVRDQTLVEYYAADFDAYGDAAFLGIADLNGDGVMEVALRAGFWEGTDVAVYELQGGGLEPVLSTIDCS